MSWTVARFLCVTAIMAAIIGICHLPAPAVSDAARGPFRPEKAGFAVRVHNQVTTLRTLGVYVLPEEELEIITMCGHGLIAANRVRSLVADIRLGYTSAERAGEQVASPCLCGIVNRERAVEVFERLAAI